MTTAKIETKTSNRVEEAAEIDVSETNSTPESRAKALVQKLGIGYSYPFTHNFIETSMGAMHYVDEGEGQPVLTLHGNPSWSFLYREFIKGLSGQSRVIAPDHIGSIGRINALFPKTHTH